MSGGAWHVYLLRCADDTLYTGIARDLDVEVVGTPRRGPRIDVAECLIGV